MWKPEELRKLLPKTLGLFTQPFASFVMELNVYGFVHYGSGNAEGDYFEFGQDGFQRGKPGRCTRSARRRTSGGTGTRRGGWG